MPFRPPNHPVFLIVVLVILTGATTLVRAEDLPPLPPVHGNISPSGAPNEPFTTQPSGLPPAERTTTDATVLIGPQKESARTWTLPELVDEALRRNPSTSEAWQNARASEADLGVAKSYYYPTVTLSASGGPSHSTAPIYPGTSTVDQWAGGPELDIQYLLLDFGARKSGVEAARFNLLVNNFNFNQTLQSVVLTVMTNFYNLDYSRSNLENAETALALAQSNLQSTDIRSRVGLVPVTDVYQARQSVAQAQYNLENARGAASQAKVQLLTSVGIPGNSKLEVASPTTLPSAKILEEEVDKLVDKAMRQRPDLASRYATWRAQLAKADQAEANRWPTLSTGIRLERSYYDAHVNPEAGFPSYNGSGHADGASALLTFSWDVFDGGNKSNAAKSAKRQAEAARAALAQAELGAISDVVLNFIAFKTATKSVEAAEELVASSQQSYDSINISYKSGLKNIIDLLTAQSNLTAARSSLALSRSNLYTAAASLANATGDILPRPLAANAKPSVSTPASESRSDGTLPLPTR